MKIKKQMRNKKLLSDIFGLIVGLGFAKNLNGFRYYPLGNAIEIEFPSGDVLKIDKSDTKTLIKIKNILEKENASIGII